MNAPDFPEHVEVYAGINVLIKIETVDQALVFLTDRPRYMQIPRYRAALKTCRYALDGACSGAAAWAAFVAFADGADIMAPKPPGFFVRKAGRMSAWDAEI